MEAAAASRDGISVHYRVRVQSLSRCGQDGLLVGIQRGGGVGVGLCCGAVDKLVCNAHHRIQVADIGAHPSAQKPRGQGEAGGVLPHNLRGRAGGRLVIASQHICQRSTC